MKSKKHKSPSERLWRYYTSIAKRTLVPLVRLLQACGLKYRFLNFYNIAIGHLTAEPDCFIKERRLGLRPPVKEIWIAPQDMVANQHLLGYWEPHLRIWKSPWARLLIPVARDETLGTGYVMPIHEAALFPQIQAAWGDREPLLKLSKEDYERGWAVLKKLGVPEGAWFVCFHSREGGYWPKDEHINVYRNADIRSYMSAMEMVVERGGWCIRVGDKTMTPLPSMPHVIDYAMHEVKSDWMDVFLGAACKGFLGCSSGLYLISSIFGRRAALTNLFPFSCALSYGARDVSMPKLLWSTRDKRYLTFKEILDSPIGGFRLPRQYEEAGITTVDNTPEEIQELTIELLETASGTIRYSAEDEDLQRRFKSLMRPCHYSFGAASRVGRHFLRQHANLLAGA